MGVIRLSEHIYMLPLLRSKNLYVVHTLPEIHPDLELNELKHQESNQLIFLSIS